jgi:hypothetical protein
MSEPDWAKLLSITYNRTGEAKFKTDSEREILPEILSNIDKHEYESISIEHNEFRDSIEYLENMDLIHRRKDNIGTVNDQEYISKITLTKDGFDVAHEREQKKTQHQNNRNVLLFTIVLAFSALLQTFADLMSLQGLEFIAMAIIFIISNIIIVIIFIQQHDKKFNFLL